MSEDTQATTKVPVRITVLKTIKQKGHEAANEGLVETIEVREFATEPAIVKFALDAKKCVSFNSAGVMVGIDLPCYVEEIPAAFDEAKAMVRDRLIAELTGLNTILEQIIPS